MIPLMFQDSTSSAVHACPLDYRTDLAGFQRDSDLSCRVLYVAGGLYGNAEALAALKALIAARDPGATLVLNGDAHFFDAEPDWLSVLDAELAHFPALRGNVETEMSRSGPAQGCGCGYPLDVDEGVVHRSDAIVARLKGIAEAFPLITRRLQALPMTLVAEVSGIRVGIVHGDAASLAGWNFDASRLDQPAALPFLKAVREESCLSLFASTHSCTAAMRQFSISGQPFTIANNGAAGMANFASDPRGLVTRIAPFSSDLALYGCHHGPLVVEAVPVPFDLARFMQVFDRVWPAGSEAALSYRHRLVSGPAHTVMAASAARR